MSLIKDGFESLVLTARLYMELMRAVRASTPAIVERQKNYDWVRMSPVRRDMICT
jgi:hypothetical protein